MKNALRLPHALLLSIAALFLFEAAGQAQSGQINDPFNFFSTLINNEDQNYFDLLGDGYQPNLSDTNWIICGDEDNGSTIEATVGQKISIIYNFPRVATSIEASWTALEKNKAWTTTFNPDLLQDLYAGWMPMRHIRFNLYQGGYPFNNSHRLTDADFQLAKDASNNSYYPQWCYYRSFQAVAPGDAEITSVCTIPSGKTKAVSVYFHITGEAPSPSPSPSPSANPSDSPKHHSKN